MVYLEWVRVGEVGKGACVQSSIGAVGWGAQCARACGVCAARRGAVGAVWVSMNIGGARGEVVLVERVLDGDHRVVGDELLVHLHELLARLALALVVVLRLEVEVIDLEDIG